jgi:endoglucanase Acf2
MMARGRANAGKNIALLKMQNTATVSFVTPPFFDPHESNAFAICALVLSSSTAGSLFEIVPVGPGGYILEKPAICEALPAVIYKSDHLEGPTPTNQWWSSLVWEVYSQILFPHPLGMVCHEGGLTVTYPGGRD